MSVSNRYASTEVYHFCLSCWKVCKVTRDLQEPSSHRGKSADVHSFIQISFKFYAEACIKSGFESPALEVRTSLDQATVPPSAVPTSPVLKIIMETGMSQSSVCSLHSHHSSQWHQITKGSSREGANRVPELWWISSVLLPCYRVSNLQQKMKAHNISLPPLQSWQFLST